MKILATERMKRKWERRTNLVNFHIIIVSCWVRREQINEVFISSSSDRRRPMWNCRKNAFFSFVFFVFNSGLLYVKWDSLNFWNFFTQNTRDTSIWWWIHEFLFFRSKCDEHLMSDFGDEKWENQMMWKIPIRKKTQWKWKSKIEKHTEKKNCYENDLHLVLWRLDTFVVASDDIFVIFFFLSTFCTNCFLLVLFLFIHSNLKQKIHLKIIKKKSFFLL